MALQFSRIPIITEPVTDIMSLIEPINFRIDEINRAMQDVELEIAKLSGVDTHRPTFHNNLNLQNFQVKNVARSREPQDVVTRRELEEIGLLGNIGGEIRLKGDLVVEGSLTIEGSSGGGSGVVTGNDLEEAIDTAIGDNVATSVSGDIIDEEDATGANGATQGTLSMAKEGTTGKAEFLKMVNGALVIHDPDVKILLGILIDEIRALRNEL